MTAYDQTELAQALLSEIGDALFLLDPDTDRLLEVNPVVLRLTGFTRAELLKLTATHLFRFEAAGGMQRLKGAFTKTVVFHGQDGFVLRTKTDGWQPVSLTVSRLHLHPKPLGLIIVRDDRERRAALVQARRVEAELRTVLGSSPAALWSAERAAGPDVFSGWQFRYVSPLLARIAGRPAEFFDHPFKWADVIHPAEREAYRVALRRLLLGGDDIEQLYRVRAPDRSVRWVRDRLQVVRDESGRPARLDGCLTDVTEQRTAEEAVRRARRGSARWWRRAATVSCCSTRPPSSGTRRRPRRPCSGTRRRDHRAERSRVRPPGGSAGRTAAAGRVPEPPG